MGEHECSGVSREDRRSESRIEGPREVWRLSAMDLNSSSRGCEYSRARDVFPGDLRKPTV
jgi:polyphosphate kinase 2 (PPK2 family)